MMVCVGRWINEKQTFDGNNRFRGEMDKPCSSIATMQSMLRTPASCVRVEAGEDFFEKRNEAQFKERPFCDFFPLEIGELDQYQPNNHNYQDTADGLAFSCCFEMLFAVKHPLRHCGHTGCG